MFQPLSRAKTQQKLNNQLLFSEKTEICQHIEKNLIRRSYRISFEMVYNIINLNIIKYMYYYYTLLIM